MLALNSCVSFAYILCDVYCVVIVFFWILKLALLKVTHKVFQVFCGHTCYEMNDRQVRLWIAIQFPLLFVISLIYFWNMHACWRQSAL